MDSSRGLKILSFLFKFLCLVACIYQVSIVLGSYFRYEVSTRTDYEIVKTFQIKDTSFCYRYQDLIDAQKVAKKYNFPSNWTYSNKHWSQSRHGFKLLFTATISDIFEFTPEPENFIYSCTVPKSSDSIVPHFMVKSKCFNYFTIVKYFMIEYICYRIKWKEEINLDLEMIGTSFYYSSVSYVIYINRTYHSQVRSIRPILHLGIPWETRYFSAPIWKGLSYNYSEEFVLSFNNLRLVKLRYPYSDTICDENADIYTCKKHCFNNQTMNKYNRLSPHFIYTEPVNHRHLTHIELRNETFTLELSRIQENCFKRCRIDACNNVYTLTYSEYVSKLVETDQIIVVKVGQPSGPSITIRYYPKNEFYDVFIYVCSTLGTWLGVVVIQLDPFLYYRKFRSSSRKKKSKKRPNRTPITCQINNHSTANLIYNDIIYTSTANLIYNDIIYTMIANRQERMARLANMTRNNHFEPTT